MQLHAFKLWLRLFIALSVPTILACAGTAERLVDRAAAAGEREAGERVDRGVGAAADSVERAVLGGGEEPTGAEAGNRDPSDPTGADPAEATAPGQGADLNFDFSRGERPIFVEDYTEDNLGDFPRDFTLIGGNWAVVEWEGRRFLRGTSDRDASFQIELPEPLPERFTLEFEVMYTHHNQAIVVAPSPIEGPWNRYDGALIHVKGIQTGLMMPAEDRDMTVRIVEGVAPIDRPTPIRMMVDGSHVKVYAGTQRVSNVPNAVVNRSDRIHVQILSRARPETPIYLGPIRVDAGGRDLYSEIEREGRVAVRGILFETDSDRIQPESRPVLDEIGVLLREHPDLRLSIEGHTDSQGSEEYNRELSQRRAEAVRRWLLAEYDIEPPRLAAVGRGEAEPVASNETEDGRRQNRRVELVRVGR